MHTDAQMRNYRGNRLHALSAIRPGTEVNTETNSPNDKTQNPSSAGLYHVYSSMSLIKDLSSCRWIVAKN